MAALYDWYRKQYVHAFGVAASEEASRELQNYASLMVAVIDGLAIQRALDPGSLDVDGAFDLWERLLQTAEPLAERGRGGEPTEAAEA